MQKTVFIDRDGVINRRLISDWIKTWSEFEMLEGVPKSLRLLKDAGYRVILITNQRCLALGLINRAELDALHVKMNRHLEEQSAASFDDIFVCPHDRDDGCDCRKPRPGMFLHAANKYPDIDLSKCVMFGDSDSDEGAAVAAGCKGFYRIDESTSLLDQVKVYLDS
jgi:D-glycero-D-manno-heptose 1,7-bisphosphate phosphatase